MRGYPKHIATKQDFLNLLNMPEYKEQALKDLQGVFDVKDDAAEIVKSYDTDAKGEMINIVKETVEAPNPLWKTLGFKSRDELAVVLKDSAAGSPDKER